MNLSYLQVKFASKRLEYNETNLNMKQQTQ